MIDIAMCLHSPVKNYLECPTPKCPHPPPAGRLQ